MKLAKGIAIVAIVGGEEITYSQNYACPEHGISVEEITPRMFSFNNPFGACPKCTGIGVFMKIDPDLIIPDPSKSIRQGGLKGSGWALEGNTIAEAYMVGLADHYGFRLIHLLKIYQRKLLIFYFTVLKVRSSRFIDILREKVLKVTKPILRVS